MVKISVAKLSVAMLKAGIESSRRLAEVTGLSANTISRFRNGGSVKLPTLRRLAEALGCDPSDLIEEA